jgi:hypothetical protein
LLLVAVRAGTTPLVMLAAVVLVDC